MGKSYEELEPEILAALGKQPLLGIKDEKDGFTIVGMSSISLNSDTESITFGGKSIPVVVVIGTASGRIYQYAIKALLPNLEI